METKIHAAYHRKEQILRRRRRRSPPTFSRTQLNHSAFSWQNSYSLALASALAYERNLIEAASRKASNWGFSFSGELNERSTQGIVLADDDVVVIAFRGTEMNLRDWIGNLNIAATDSPVGRVHQGFWRAFQDVESALISQLVLCNTSGKKVWLCGHSLGGALAVLAGASLRLHYRIAGVYTYGQPKLHVNRLADLYTSELPNRYVRFVYKNDIVPRIPPGYSHFGEVRRIDEHAELSVSRMLATSVSNLTPDDAVAEGDELTMSEFEGLQNELLTEASRDLGSSNDPEHTLPRGAFTGNSRLLSPFSNHSLEDAYIPAIERQL